MKSSMIPLAALVAFGSAQDTSSSTQTIRTATPFTTATAMIGTATATGSSPPPASTPIAVAVAEIGCFSSLGSDFSDQSYTSIYMSHGLCLSHCQAGGFLYAALQKNECKCGTQIPQNDDVAPHSSCNQPCAGFPMDICGGEDSYTLLTSQFNNGTTSGSSTGLQSTASSAGISPSGSSSAQPIPTAGAARLSVGGVAAGVLGAAGFFSLL